MAWWGVETPATGPPGLRASVSPARDRVGHTSYPSALCPLQEKYGPNQRPGVRSEGQRAAQGVRPTQACRSFEILTEKSPWNLGHSTLKNLKAKAQCCFKHLRCSSVFLFKTKTKLANDTWQESTFPGNFRVQWVT